MGIHMLASTLAIVFAFDVQAATLPHLPQPKLADLSLKVTAPVAPALDSHSSGYKSVAEDARWLNERLPLAQEQRWVF